MIDVLPKMIGKRNERYAIEIFQNGTSFVSGLSVSLKL